MFNFIKYTAEFSASYGRGKVQMVNGVNPEFGQRQLEITGRFMQVSSTYYFTKIFSTVLE
jgi:hypothetical protein